VPTDNLPWFEPALSLFGGSVSGFGDWVIPVQGAHVYLFFEGGNILQGRFFCTVPGFPTDQNHGFKSDEGFSDPDKNFPKKTRLNEPDWHRLSRDEYEKTIVEHKQNNLTKNIQIAQGNGTWDEPDSYYLKNNNKYPNNNVIAAPSGIVIELDSSENPRLHIYHPSNSYVETDDEGNTVIKNSGNKFEIILQNYNKYIDGDKNETIKGDKNLKIDGDYNTEINGNKSENIVGDSNKEIEGNTEQNCTGNTDINSEIITLNKRNGITGGLVTTAHVCGITGLPHPDGSISCLASKL
jgi:hypothetical protein